MFKVPDWGSDIPKSDGEVIKLFANKNKKKNTDRVSPKIKGKLNKKKVNNRKNNVNVTGNLKNKVNGNKILSREDHINNRIMKRNCKLAAEATKANGIGTQNIKGKFVQKGNKPVNFNDNDKNNKMKHKKLKIKNKVSELESDPEKDKVKPENGFKQRNLNHTNKDKEDTLAIKRRLNNTNSVNNTEGNNIDLQNFDTDEPDKILVNVKRTKLLHQIKNDDNEDVLFGDNGINENQTTTNENNNILSKNKIKEIPVNNQPNEISSKMNKTQKKKEALKQLLQRHSNRNVINISGNKLRQRMLERLKAAQFRYLNEKLYTSSGSESQELFKLDPAAFQTYHEGYQLQVKKWPINPLDLIVQRIQKMPKSHVIADMGCGEAALARRVPQRVHSFDLVAGAPGVTACDMARTPLPPAACDAVVYCLALMGTGLTQYLLEANRVLKIGGHLLIAEVESRFESADAFASDVQRLGFTLKRTDDSHRVFVFMEFTKVRDAPAKKAKLPALSLKPCLYKRR